MASDPHKIILNIINILHACSFLTLAGCMDASTRGGEAADHIVISGTPSWSNGIGELLNKKCATCHQVPRLASSPVNVPADLDLRFEKLSGATRAAEDIAAAIKLGILNHTLNYGMNGNNTMPAMPLSYSTPMYSDEIAALESWANAVITSEQSGTSPVLSGNAVSDGELLYKRHCQGCHGQYGAGGVINWSLRGRGANAAPQFATAILSTSPTYPMNNWPVLQQFATGCSISGTSACSTLDAIAAYLNTF